MGSYIHRFSSTCRVLLLLVVIVVSTTLLLFLVMFQRTLLL